MTYKLLPGASKMLPKVFFAEKNIKSYNPSSEVLRIRDEETFKKGDSFSLTDCHTLIDFYKSSIERHADWSKFNFKFSPTESYQDISEFYHEVEKQGYKLSFEAIDGFYIEELVKSGKLYLFKIYNKDFSEHSKGTPNLHTIYWKMLFDEQNLQHRDEQNRRNILYKLNGEAEMFYRKKSIEEKDRIIHPQGKAIKNKNKNKEKDSSVFKYDLIKDKRYTEENFSLHVSITMNFGSNDKKNINDMVNAYLRKEKDLHIIGIDRGERNLLYLTMIDMEGNIKHKQQYSLNEIVNVHREKEYKTNYHTLLGYRETEREEARRNWQRPEAIKELKEGYLSQAIHKITILMVEYNAILVLEDLNRGFKNSRQKIEKSIYQKFEKMLIDKLNYLVDKKKEPNETGGCMKALQLTNPFESFEKMGKQNGFLFYVDAWNTSKIDPVTGFVNLLDTRYTSKSNAKEFFGQFKDIRYNRKKNVFEFDLDYSKFRKGELSYRKEWTLCTYGKRIQKSSDGTILEIVLTDLFMELLKDGLDNIPAFIQAQDSTPFFKNLLSAMYLMLQMRNSKPGHTEIDYIVSPVQNSSGECYDSNKEKEAGTEAKLPIDADANGAYNIARKGLLLLQRIQSQENDQKLNLAISRKEWLKFAQEKEMKKNE